MALSGQEPRAEIPQEGPNQTSGKVQRASYLKGVPGADSRGDPEGVIPGVTSGVAPGVRMSVLRAWLSSRLSAMSGTSPCSTCPRVTAAGPKSQPYICALCLPLSSPLVDGLAVHTRALLPKPCVCKTQHAEGLSQCNG